MSGSLVFALVVFTLCLLHALVLQGWSTRIVEAMRERLVLVTTGELPFISVLVPARNAADTIVPLLQDLHAQQYPRDRYEVLVIDDHSTDETSPIVSRMEQRWPGLRLVPPGMRVGKKAAIEQGVSEACGPLVLMTDADVRCGPDRLRSLAMHWLAKRPDLVIMPVATSGGEGVVAGLQRCEQAALQGATAGSALSGSPILANGANMAFTIGAFRQVGGYSNDHWVSGDDVFLLERMRRAGLKVTYLADPDAAVLVEPEPTWHAFLTQRLRWSGKMRGSRNGRTKLTGSFALVLPWALIALTISYPYKVHDGTELWYPFLLLMASWSIWVVPVLRLVRSMEHFFGNAGPWAAMHRGRPTHYVNVLLSVFAFVVYAPIIALLALFIRPMWRGRRI